MTNEEAIKLKGGDLVRGKYTRRIWEVKRVEERSGDTVVVVGTSAGEGRIEAKDVERFTREGGMS